MAEEEENCMLKKQFSVCLYLSLFCFCFFFCYFYFLFHMEVKFVLLMKYVREVIIAFDLGKGLHVRRVLKCAFAYDRV